MTQLSLFDTYEEAPAAAVTTPVTTPLLPTFFVEYYDEDMAWRLSWVRAKDVDAASYTFRKNHKYNSISKVYESDRDFDELEALD